MDESNPINESTPNPYPNILWYCTDQQRFDTIRALGNKHINTPRLDAFLNEGTTFTHAYCQSPICTPSRASFLTGMYPSALRVSANGVPSFPEEHAEHLLPSILANNGYLCGLTGKLHLTAAAQKETRVQDGYGFFEYSHAPARDYHNHNDYYHWIKQQGADPEEVLKRYDRKRYPLPEDDMFQGGLFEPNEKLDNAPSNLHQTHWCTEMGIDFIQSAQDAGKPWLLSVNVFDPHAPFDPPNEYYRRYDSSSLPEPIFDDNQKMRQDQLAYAGIDFQTESRPPSAWKAQKIKAAYYAMIEQIDTEFGRLLDFLDASGQRENTVVVFMSDHGEMLGDHGLMLKGCRFYDGLTRVPLIFSWPGRIQSGLQSDALVELIDVMPTLLNAAGVEVPDHVQGKSLWPIVGGNDSSYIHRDYVRSEYYHALKMDAKDAITSSGNEPSPYDGTKATMYRNRQWKLVVYHGHNEGELYDMETDPEEKNDLWSQSEYQAVKIDLLKRSFDATIEAVDTGPEPVLIA